MLRSVTVFIFLSMCMLISTVSASDLGVFATTPSGLPPERILAAAKLALTNRDWVIDVEEPDAITARYVKSPYRARIRIVLVGDRVLIYENLAERQRTGPPNDQSPPNLQFMALPIEWLDRLRAEFRKTLDEPELRLPAWSER